MPDTASTEQTGQPVLDAIEEALLQGAASHAHRARNIAQCIAEAGYEIVPNPSRHSPRGALLEVIEFMSTPDETAMLPNEVRLNGVPLLQPEGESITVTSSVNHESFVTAELSLICRRVVMEPRQRGQS